VIAILVMINLSLIQIVTGQESSDLAPGFHVDVNAVLSNDSHIATEIEVYEEEEKENKIKICHIPPGNPDNAHTIEVSQSAIEAHLDHGDSLGPCDDVQEPPQLIQITLQDSLPLTDQAQASLPSAPKSIQITLQDSFSLTDQAQASLPSAPKSIQITLQDSFSLTDQAQSSLPSAPKSIQITLQDSFSLTDQAQSSLPSAPKSIQITLQDSFSLTDQAQASLPSAPKSIQITLQDSLPLTDQAQSSLPSAPKSIQITLQDSLPLTDQAQSSLPSAPKSIQITLQDSFSLTDQAQASLPSAPKSIQITLQDSLLLTDRALILDENKIIIDNSQTSVTITKNNKQIVITGPNHSLNSIFIEKGVSNLTLNLSALQGSPVTLPKGFEILADLDDSKPSFDIRLRIFDSTIITGPPGWDAIINLPSFIATTILELFETSSSTSNGITTTTTITTSFSDITAFVMGLDSGQLSFDPPARIEFSGDGGQGYAAFYITTSNEFTFITIQCDADDLVTVSSQLNPGETCIFDDGTDLIIWTTHFTNKVRHTSQSLIQQILDI